MHTNTRPMENAFMWESPRCRALRPYRPQPDQKRSDSQLHSLAQVPNFRFLGKVKICRPVAASARRWANNPTHEARNPWSATVRSAPNAATDTNASHPTIKSIITPQPREWPMGLPPATFESPTSRAGSIEIIAAMNMFQETGSAPEMVFRAAIMAAASNAEVSWFPI